MKKSEFFLIFLFAVIVVLPIFLNIQNTFPRLDTDYDAVLPLYQYVGAFVRSNHTLPAVIPFIGKGIPLFGDPINGIYNPLLLVPLIYFDINISIRITIFFIIFLSGLAQFIFLRKLKIPKVISTWGAMLYMTSGVLIAAVAAGHITEKFLTLPIIPLFLLHALNSQVKFKKYLYMSLSVSYAIYSGDLYMSWFFFIFIFSLETLFFIQFPKIRKKRLFYTTMVPLLSVLFSLPVLYPFYTVVLPIMRRPTIIDPFLGSIHALFFPLQFLIPFQVNFYDRPFFQKHLGFYYNWYEYYGFLGLFPIIFLKNFLKVIANKYTRRSIYLLAIGSLYLASAYFYSPFHWLFMIWNNNAVFRVPQRIVIPITPVVILIFCIFASSWRKKSSLYIIFFTSLLWTLIIDWHTFSYTFIPLPKGEAVLVKKFASIDVKKIPVVDFVGKTQYFLSVESIPIINYYYAWVNKSTPTVVTNKGIIILKNLQKERPRYILASRKISFSDIGYSIVYADGMNAIWEIKQ